MISPQSCIMMCMSTITIIVTANSISTIIIIMSMCMFMFISTIDSVSAIRPARRRRPGCAPAPTASWPSRSSLLVSNAPKGNGIGATGS